ncbi:MAG TPA: S8 family serine peptidase [Pyrinomonadaceae bacterium]|jgi:subtilisin family serine protease
MILIPSPLVEFILLGPSDDRRQLQDSPILGDVWVELGKNPSEQCDLLIAPYRGRHAGEVAAKIYKGLGANEGKAKADIAFLQGLVAARLTFEEVMRVVVPKTQWWINKRSDDDESAPAGRKDKDAQAGAPQPAAPPAHEVDDYDAGRVRHILEKVLGAAGEWHSKAAMRLLDLSGLERFLALSALLLWAESATGPDDTPKSADAQIDYLLREAESPANLDGMSGRLADLTKQMAKDETERPLVWQVSLNRGAMPAISKSVPAVKADAATTLFKVDCSEITWAVIDSGIDGAHPAFFDKRGQSRVKRSFDFKHFRKIVSLSNENPDIRAANLEVLMRESESLLEPPGEEEADRALERLALDALEGLPVRWELVERFVELNPKSEKTRPRLSHGTHVAGIIGASRRAAVKAAVDAAVLKARLIAEEKRALLKPEEGAAGGPEAGAEKKAEEEAAERAVEEDVERARKRAEGKEYADIADGMCPDINLYDFRVLGGAQVKDTEFAIIAVLQFIRHLNDRGPFLVIHGANMSLSIPHDVRNFACGRTPICEEAERLVASGVVVVAAAGNHGYKSFETKEGAYDSYAAFSITDPGNADSVLTVGATHRFWPHTYGISFFSSRGPTGDGRLKPDMVAPGERIRAPLPGKYDAGGDWGDLDGTSMAAPHVSGAAAMLMGRYSELVGQPRRIKRILCESATDLGRERSFQGHGMLDVLRAFQSI